LELQPLIENRLKSAYKSTTQGKFSEALTNFLYILHSLPLVVVNSKKEAKEAIDLLGICRDYISGVRMELLKKRSTICK